MPTFDVHVEILDRRSSFTAVWPAANEQAVIADVTRKGGVDVYGDDGSTEFFPLAGIRKITITPAEEEATDGETARQ